MQIPAGYITSSAGEPGDVRDTINVNSDFFNNQFYLDEATHADRERIPERVVHAKGVGTYGYFEVTNDVSKYTKAEVFNGVGKKTRLALRFSTSRPRLGGSDLGREFKGLGVKFYSKEGNLDLTCLQTPIFMLKDPVDFFHSVRSLRFNPKANVIDWTMQWEFSSLKPARIPTFLWVFADYGIPKNYRTMDLFPIHTYEINNENRESYYVKFNFRTLQGLDNFTSSEAQAVASEDPDYYSRDLYNAISEKNYPEWRLEMDVLSKEDLKMVDYDPFDITRPWKAGTYKTVTIGRVVVNETATNHFRDSELGAFNPGNLVPGIAGPVDFVFKARRMVYRDTQNYRLGINHHEIKVNVPKYKRTYNRDGLPPVRDNMRDNPNYYPNSFRGSVSIVDEGRPDQKLLVLSNNAIDFETIADFYENVIQDDAHRQRLSDNIASSLVPVLPKVTRRVLRLLELGHPDLGKRVARSLKLLKAATEKQSTRARYDEIAQCLAKNMENKNH